MFTVTFALLTQDVAASTWLDSFDATFDTTVQANGASVLKRDRILIERFQAEPTVVDMGMPANVRIAALTIDGSAVLYTPDVGFKLNGMQAMPRDVVRRNPDGASAIFLRGSDVGLATHVERDALASAGSNVLFNVDVSTSIAGIKVAPADVLRWNDTSISVLHSAQSLGLEPGVIPDGLEQLANGDLLMTFDAVGRVAGISFKAGEILWYTPSSAQWSLRRPVQSMQAQ